MGWFNKKESVENTKGDYSFGSLPELPKLPDLPDLQEKKMENKEVFHQLPSFPNSSLGQKFSQNTIKDAISRKDQVTDNFYPEGKKGERVFEADDFAKYKQKAQMMPKPLKQIKEEKEEFNFPAAEEIENPVEDFEIKNFEAEPSEFKMESNEFKESDFGSFKKEPVFIRIDKFEEALKVFEKTKKEVAEIEKTIKDITQVKEDEDKELESWQNDIVKIKEQIDKVDKDIFSKIE
jgi:hypothetical protein